MTTFKWLICNVNFFPYIICLINFRRTLPSFLTVIICSSAPAVSPFAHVTSAPATKYYLGDNVTHWCKTGYEMSSGSTTRKCTSINTWDATQLVCTSNYFAISTYYLQCRHAFSVYCSILAFRLLTDKQIHSISLGPSTY